uniref:Uncharacterized protein n=1 Tax=Anguilla anguilla TaxID=7936 RepID=A0A0E9V4K1_ANGAN
MVNLSLCTTLRTLHVPATETPIIASKDWMFGS